MLMLPTRCPSVKDESRLKLTKAKQKTRITCGLIHYLRSLMVPVTHGLVTGNPYCSLESKLLACIAEQLVCRRDLLSTDRDYLLICLVYCVQVN